MHVPGCRVLRARKPLVGTGCFCARPKHTTLAMDFWMENEKLRLGRGAEVILGLRSGLRGLEGFTHVRYAGRE
jgi:hypothetical protein